MNNLKIEPEKGILNKGNWYRIKRVMRKAMKGEEITVGFLGGSITQGCLSSTPETCYAYLVYDWWMKKFPNTKVNYVNAGIGGTTSQFGVARADKDLIKFDIDFSVVEFSVNDVNNDHFQETYEGLIRKLYSSKTAPALLIVNSVQYNDGVNAQEKHNEIGKLYQIPCVSMKPTIYAKVESGEIKNTDITPDDLHPNDAGHALMAEVITYFLEQVYADLENDTEQENAMPASMTKNAYENSVRYQNNEAYPINRGFDSDETPQNDIREIFRNGWTASEKGASITFMVEGTCLAVQYRKSVVQPTPIARAVIDGKEDKAVILDGNFEETWGDSLHLETIAEHIAGGLHEVKIEIIEAHEDDKVPFYLTSIIASE